MDLPHSFDAWETRLVRYFLEVGPTGDDSPLRALEVSPATLRLACGAPTGSEQAVEAAFRDTLKRDPHLLPSLRYGSKRARTADLPNCFTYLALTLLIDNQIEGESTDLGDFRQKLLHWLQINENVTNLKGVALMWESLASWLEARIRLGAPYRSLTLPVLDNRLTHIGYTRLLSFPSKTDIRLATRFCQEHPDVLRNPQVCVQGFDRFLYYQSTSWGLHNAYEEFCSAWLRGRRALGGLRFWRLMERASAIAGRPGLPCTTIDMLFDLDRQPVFFASSEARPDEGLDRSAKDSGVGEENLAHDTLDAAIDDAEVAKSENLGTAAAQGLLFFQLIGAGRWRAVPEPISSAFGMHVAFAERHRRRLRDTLGELQACGSWMVTTRAQALEIVQSALKAARLVTVREERIVRPGLSAGVLTQGLWLGRRRFLPRIDSDTDDYVVKAVGSEEAPPVLSIRDGQCVSTQRIEGAFVIQPARRVDEPEASWRLRLQLVADAFVHPTLGGARYKLSRLRDWAAGAPAHIEVAAGDDLLWEAVDTDCEDLLEAVYASGRSGWEEAELITLLRRATEVISPWMLLRTLQDAGIVQPRLRKGWKGRAWTLEPVRILEAHSTQEPILIVEGALCARIIAKLRLVVSEMGGRVFRRQGLSPWSPPLIGAVGVEGKVLTDRLGWPFTAAPTAPLDAPLAMEQTRREGQQHAQAGQWSWQAKRFIEGEAPLDGVPLRRLRHIGGRDHDIYCLGEGDRAQRFLSRTAAVCAAHAKARIPMFVWQAEHGQLAATCRDAGLPDALSTYVRRRMLRNAGPVEGDYRYSASEDLVRWLAERMPGCIGGLPTTAAESVPVLVDRARRSSGRLRVQWRNGSTTL